jgi:hypothetical protein
VHGIRQSTSQRTDLNKVSKRQKASIPPDLKLLNEYNTLYYYFRYFTTLQVPVASQISKIDFFRLFYSISLSSLSIMYMTRYTRKRLHETILSKTVITKYMTVL